MSKKNNIFKSVLMPKVDSNQFDLSHDVKLSFNMGELVPTCIMDVVPGDKVTISVENMLRFAPLVYPTMHKINVATHYFFVPNRILWSEWEEWITGESNVMPPTVKNIQTSIEGDLSDYMGIPLDVVATGTKVSVLPFAAYAKIYDEYYRDQNLQTSKMYDTVIAGDNPNYEPIAFAPLKKRAWEHDYFTSCLPFAQKGDAVTLPLINQGGADVTLKTADGTPQVLKDATTGLDPNVAGNLNQTPNLSTTGGTSTDVNLDPNGTLEVDINADATDINTLRRAFRLQEWLEKNARGGTRYIENILAHFGVTSSDSRLQRPEYIGGSKQKMIISEVLSTAQTIDGSSNEVPVGMLAGHGISVGGGNNFSYRAEEHGYIIGIMSVMPETAYQQGIHKSFQRTDRLDYFWPTFANIGEQEVLNQEVYTDGQTGSVLAETFGYIPRYSEYKFLNSRVAGKMRDELSFTHLGRIFSSKPSLNSAFIECNPSRRIFAVTDPAEDTIIAHVFNNIHAVRKMPKYGIPSI